MAENNLKFLLRDKGSKRVGLKVIDYKIKANDDIVLTIITKDKEIKKVIYNEEKHELWLGGKKVEPYLSYAINNWNVMLPYITYSFHKNECLTYIQSIAYDGVYEKEDV